MRTEESGSRRSGSVVAIVVAVIGAGATIFAAVITAGVTLLSSSPSTTGSAGTTTVTAPQNPAPGTSAPGPPSSVVAPGASRGPSASASRAIVRPGEQVSFTGRGFPPSQQLTFTWFVNSGQVDLGYADLSSTGTFSVTVTIPADVCNSRAGSVYVAAQPSYSVVEVPLRVSGASC
ncbi:hypothetical protein [Actinomycetospora soli]|uniref:hypothetical protein n=1 Tax=Actinomycetospora soli TaxID=2893887 RepID=UPI001E2D63D7|nr:hypothetical protein [Actinomycetospora soli]MCD2187817.1 hypothetical protein [Actinomycetospora soli]